MLGILCVDRPNLLEQCPIGLVGEALDQPVDCWVEKALVLIVWQLMVPVLHDVIVEFEHVLDHEQEIVFVLWIDSITNSSKVRAGIRRTKRLSYASNHLSQADKIRLMHTSLHVFLGANH